jgi:hypothetical protein
MPAEEEEEEEEKSVVHVPHTQSPGSGFRYSLPAIKCHNKKRLSEEAHTSKESVDKVEKQW